MSYLSKSKWTSLRAAFSVKSRGDGRAAVGLSVRGGAPRLAPAAPIADCEAAGWVRLAAVEPAELPGEGGDSDAGIVAGCFARPVACRTGRGVGIIGTVL